MLNFFLDRLTEPSTWRGFVMLLTGAGVSINPDMAAGIVSAGAGTAGLLGVLTKDRD